MNQVREFERIGPRHSARAGMTGETPVLRFGARAFAHRSSSPRGRELVRGLHRRDRQTTTRSVRPA